MAEFKEVMTQRERMCELNKKESGCSDCPIQFYKNGRDCNCKIFILHYPQEAEELIMKWASENPIKTWADKFEEVFGLKVNNHICPFNGLAVCEEVRYCKDCELYDFWSREYVEPDKEKKNGC